ncbi:hypothetical protein [Noviluteimonas gilva]|uniref:Transposase n=1 Tax=Noviluteimonas gilva TaxID=2682097 RepID=A0A7C9HXT8_9GAMM|nr:hypothetical protein [Lysobacter gilvus]MUV13554.1 hypothetical protein [Lysobacter gilvus]
MKRERLTTEMVWMFMREGCNANEIAEYGGVALATAIAWMGQAARTAASAPKRKTLRKAA